MSDEILIWQPDYELGVDYLDTAHKELFLVIYRFNSIINERRDGQRKSLCMAMIRYLLKYTTDHFAKEEAYMLKTKYAGYEIHKHLHDNIKNRTIPHLIQVLEEQDYSDDAIKRLTDVLSSWLASHILLEDHAIVGAKEGRWHHNHKANLIDLIDAEFKLFADDLFALKFELINRHYEGEYLGDNTYSFSSVVKGVKQNYDAILICDGDFVRYVVDRIANIDDKEITEGDLEAFDMIAESWAKAAVSLIDDSNQVEVIEASVLKGTEYSSFFKGSLPQQSLVWKCNKYQIGMAVRSDRV